MSRSGHVSRSTELYRAEGVFSGATLNQQWPECWLSRRPDLRTRRIHRGVHRPPFHQLGSGKVSNRTGNGATRCPRWWGALNGMLFFAELSKQRRPQSRGVSYRDAYSPGIVDVGRLHRRILQSLTRVMLSWAPVYKGLLALLHEAQRPFALQGRLRSSDSSRISPR